MTVASGSQLRACGSSSSLVPTVITLRRDDTGRARAGVPPADALPFTFSGVDLLPAAQLDGRPAAWAKLDSSRTELDLARLPGRAEDGALLALGLAQPGPYVGIRLTVASAYIAFADLVEDGDTACFLESGRPYRVLWSEWPPDLLELAIPFRVPAGGGEVPLILDLGATLSDLVVAPGGAFLTPVVRALDLAA